MGGVWSDGVCGVMRCGRYDEECVVCGVMGGVWSDGVCGVTRCGRYDEECVVCGVMGGVWCDKGRVEIKVTMRKVKFVENVS